MLIPYGGKWNNLDNPTDLKQEGIFSIQPGVELWRKWKKWAPHLSTGVNWDQCESGLETSLTDSLGYPSYKAPHHTQKAPRWPSSFQHIGPPLQSAV